MNIFKLPKLLVFISIILLIVVSCENEISPNLEQATPVLVVDAWLNNRAEEQIIILSLSQPYFDQTKPPPASSAKVLIENQVGEIFTFLENETQHGNYVWTPSNNLGLGEINDTFTLSITYEGLIYKAVSELKRVPPIDSITFEKQKFFGEEFYQGEFWSQDPKGDGDAYWIRSFKNDLKLNFPSEISLAIDAGFSMGSKIDGITFIPPVRSSINSGEDPFEVGDSVTVQIHSISLEAWDFLNQLKIQTDKPGGFAELFATPLANLPTNIESQDVPENRVVGFFNVAAISALSVTLNE